MIDKEVAVLQFHPYFKDSIFIANKLFNVRFSIPLSVMQRCHQGIAILRQNEIPWGFISPTRTIITTTQTRHIEVGDVRGLNVEQMAGKNQT